MHYTDKLCGDWARSLVRVLMSLKLAHIRGERLRGKFVALVRVPLLNG
jgi:hypothetical protein